jgi:hypothetical protein
MKAIGNSPSVGNIVIKSVLYGSFLILAGCGGGGEASPGMNQPNGTVASTNQFNFGSSWKAFLSKTYIRNLIVTGSCGGTIEYTHSAVSQPTSFDYSDATFPHPLGSANPGYYIWHGQKVSAQFTDCSISTSVATTTAYYDAKSFAPYGYKGGTAYNGATSYKATFREFSSPVVLPEIVKVGNSGRVGIINVYGTSNFKKDNILQGTIEVSYVVEPETSSSALINIISKSYDLTMTLLLIDQTRYRIDKDNELSLHSIEQDVSGPQRLQIIAR